MVLRGGQLMRLACRRQFRAAGEMQRFGRPQTIGVVTGTASDATGLLTAITERQADDIVCLPRLNPHGTHDFAAVELNPDQRHIELVVFVVANVEAEVFRGLRAEQNHVFPNQLGDGIGQLLQPAVIIVAAVINLVVAMENDFQRVFRRSGNRLRRADRFRHRVRVELDLDRFRRAAGQIAIVQKSFPIVFAVPRDAAIGLTHDVIRLEFVQTANAREHFQFGDAAEQRLDKRLNGNQRAVGGARVTPGFEVMRQRQMPIAQRRVRGLVFGVPKANDGLRFALSLRPVQVRRRVIDRVAAENHQRPDLPCVQRLREFGNRSFLRLRRVKEHHRFAHAARSAIQHVSDYMYRQWLSMTRQHQNFA